METPNLFDKYTWQFGLTGHASFASIGTFHEAMQVEQLLATGGNLVYFETPKGVVFSGWKKPKCQ